MTTMNHSYFKSFILLFLCFCIQELSATTTANKNSKSMVVIIDPGHGGKDPGAVNKQGIREKDVVLGIGLKLGNYINENFPDVKVVFTRNTDVFVPLIDRSRIANKHKADLFISLHANFCGVSATKGTETFVLGLDRKNENFDVVKKENSVILLEDNYKTTYENFDPNSSESYILFELIQNTYLDQSLAFAGDIQQQLTTKVSSSNRGVKQAGFLVLRQSSMPSVLVETGFLSNPSEAGYLSSEEGQKKIAQSILEAFNRFKSRNSGHRPDAIVEAQPTHNKQDTAIQKAETEKKQESATIEKPEIKNNKTSDTASSQAAPEKKDVKPEEETTAKAEEKHTPEITGPSSEKHANVKSADTLSRQSTVANSTYYSVQIGANTTPVEPVASNFKGLKNVRREKTDKYYRYYIGKESSVETISPVLKKIKLKYPQAFIVSFVDGKRIIYKPDTK